MTEIIKECYYRIGKVFFYQKIYENFCKLKFENILIENIVVLLKWWHDTCGYERNVSFKIREHFLHQLQIF